MVAAALANRDTVRTRTGHSRPDQHLVAPSPSSSNGERPSPRIQTNRMTIEKRHRSAEGEDEDIAEHRRKSRKIQESGQSLTSVISLFVVPSDHVKANQRPQNTPLNGVRSTRQSPRSQGRQLTKSQQAAKGGKTRILHLRKGEGKQQPEQDEGIVKASSKQRGVHTSR